MTRCFFFYALLSLFVLNVGCAWAQQPGYEVSVSTYFGDTSSVDHVVGSRILSNGTVVLAANLKATQFFTSQGVYRVQPLMLNGTTENSRGAIIRLSADGKKILSITRIAEQVLDMAIDDADNIYVAAANDGVIKVHPSAQGIYWVRQQGTYIKRVDASTDGYCAALSPSNIDKPAKQSGKGRLYVYDSEGTAVSDFEGYRNTIDVCVDGASKTVVLAGMRTDILDLNPVDIAYVRGVSYTGQEKWTAYDWSVDITSDRFINKPESNTAGTTAYRCSMGRDGKLYVGFEVTGGNHIFRFSPFDIMQRSPIVGGDLNHQFVRTKWNRKLFFGRYEPETGAFMLGQQFMLRGATRELNEMVIENGEITADETGRVYMGGWCGHDLPMTYNPVDSGLTSLGAFIIIWSPNFSNRVFVTRLLGGNSEKFTYTSGIGARTLSNGSVKIAWAGRIAAPLSAYAQYTQNSVQASFNGGASDGFFAQIGTDSVPGVVWPDVPKQPVSVANGLTSNLLLQAYPNPANNKLVLLVNAESGQQLVVNITNVFGQKIAEQKLQAENGLTKIETDVYGLPSGLYNVTVTAGSHRQSTKVVVKH